MIVSVNKYKVMMPRRLIQETRCQDIGCFISIHFTLTVDIVKNITRLLETFYSKNVWDP